MCIIYLFGEAILAGNHVLARWRSSGLLYICFDYTYLSSKWVAHVGWHVKFKSLLLLDDYARFSIFQGDSNPNGNNGPKRYRNSTVLVVMIKLTMTTRADTFVGGVLFGFFILITVTNRFMICAQRTILETSETLTRASGRRSLSNAGIPIVGWKTLRVAEVTLSSRRRLLVIRVSVPGVWDIKKVVVSSKPAIEGWGRGTWYDGDPPVDYSIFETSHGRQWRW